MRKISSINPFKAFFLRKELLDEYVYAAAPSEEEGCYTLAVVLGCSNYRIMRERAAAAAALYLPGRVTKILLSGGKGFLSLHRKESEATVMQRWLLQAGVLPEDILLEANSRNARENLALVLEGNEVRGSLVIVTSDFHEKRALGLFSKALEGRGDVELHAYGVQHQRVPRRLLRQEAVLLSLAVRAGLIPDEEF